MGEMVMWSEEDNEKPARNAVVLGEDLSTFSVGDIDERVAALEAEIVRLKDEKTRKTGSLEAAQSFFKNG